MNQEVRKSSRGRILAVDDEPTSLKIVAAVLGAEHYDVQVATGGEEALRLVEESQPEVILLDIVMDGLDGFEVCRRLKAQERFRHIPVIFISATTENEERLQGFKLGAVDYVVKPLERRELLARVHTHLTLTRMQVELKRQAEDLREANMLLKSEIAVRETIASSLAESEEKFRTLAGSAQDAFVMLDDGGRINFWNRAASDMFGYEEHEISGHKFCEDLVPARLRKTGAIGCFADQFTSTKSGVIHLTGLKRSGQEFPIELSIAAVKLRERWVTIVVIRDVTESVQAQETLQRSEERLSLALDATHTATWDLDLNTGIIWRSRNHDQIFGFDPPLAKWTHEDFLRCLQPEDQQRLAAQNEVVLRTGLVCFEFRIVRPNDGMERWLRIQGKLYRDPQGEPMRMMGIVLDVTEAKLAEIERQAAEVQNSLSQKLESVGRLASGVAHEINTPMQFVTDNTQFLKGALASLAALVGRYRELAETVATGNDARQALPVVRAAEEEYEIDYLLGEIPKTLEETMSGLQRVTQIVRSLKEFSHPNKSAKQPADLNKAISTTITVSRHEWKYVADLQPDLDPDLPNVPVRIDEMNQVVLNLIVNAAHAIADAIKQRGDEKGVIKVRTRLDGDHVLLEVEDNGTGIPESAQSHIFEPFFTTKGVGKGTGQGLAIVRAIVVKNHGGSIRFSTKPGVGTIFHVRLPLAVDPVS